MKKYLSILALPLVVTLFLFLNKSFIKASSNAQYDLYPITSGGINNVSCDSSFCGISINPNTQNKTYSFLYANGTSSTRYNKGIYHLSVLTTLNHEYQYRRIVVVGETNNEEYDVSGNKLSINISFQSEENFVIVFENSIKTISYVSGIPKNDSFKNFSLKKIDESENLNLGIIATDSLYNIHHDSNSVSLSPNNEKKYSFSIKNKENELFEAGSYELTFYHLLNSCKTNCDNYNYQKLIIVSSTNKEISLAYHSTNYFTYNFSTDESFYLIVENKLNYVRVDDYPIDTFRNLNLININKMNTFISISESGSLYSVNNFSKNISIEPNNENVYKFVITNGLANKKFSSGIYNLSFDFSLNTCQDNCKDYAYQKIKIVAIDNTYEHNINYQENHVSFSFNCNTYFYILIENKTNYKRTDYYPLDSFYKISLIKTGELTDQESPYFSQYQGVFISDVDNPTSVNTIKNLLTANDDVDGDITSSIVIESDNYTPNNNTIGSYDIVFSATDKSYNKAHITITVKVLDITAPIIIGENYLTCSILNGCYSNDELLSIDNLNNILEINDNIDDSPTINIVSDNWSNASSYNINNTYTIIINAEDSSHNVSDNFIIHINYIDDIPTSIVNGEEFYSGTANSLEIEQIKENILISDNFDGSKNISTKKVTDLDFEIIEDNYSTNKNTIGKHKIVFKCQNKFFNIFVNVLDNLPPIFYTDASIINIEVYNSLSQEQIIGMLKNMSIIKSEPVSYNFVVDEYSANSTKVGRYNICINLTYENEITENIQFSMQTYDIAKEVNEEKNWFERIFEKIFSFFKNLFSKIKELFT